MSAEFGRVPAHAPAAEDRAGHARPDAAAPAHITVPLGTPLAEAERVLILATLRYCGGVRKRAADLLGISSKTLYNRLLAYRLRGARPAAPDPMERPRAPGPP